MARWEQAAVSISAEKKTKKQSSVEPRSEESNLRWEATSGGKARKSREEGKQVG